MFFPKVHKQIEVSFQKSEDELRADTPPAHEHQNRLRSFGCSIGFALALALVGLCCARFPSLWGLWQISHYPGFIDAAVITAGAESVRHHIDPMYQNPYDSLQRPLNYPRIWQSLALVLPRNATYALAFSFWAAFLASLVPIVRHSAKVPFALLASCAFSPCVLLAMERGNCDLLIMGITVASICAFGTNRLLSLLLWLVAGVLKLYPIFGGGYLIIRLKRKEALIASGILTVVGLYELQNIHDLIAIRAGTPDTMLGYGRTCILLLADAAGYVPSSLVKVLYFIVLAFPLVGFLIRGRPQPNFNSKTPSIYNTAENLYLAGAGIYFGTFLLGSNHEYRQIWLLLCLPFLFRGALSKLGKLATAVTSIAILLSLWTPVVFQIMGGTLDAPGSALVVCQIAHWVVYLSLGINWTRLTLGRIRSALNISGPRGDTNARAPKAV